MDFFICPVCKEKLYAQNKSLVCNNNHTFDIAKSGYVNLLLSKQAGKNVHGDNKLMVRARRDFLSKGTLKIAVQFLMQVAERATIQMVYMNFLQQKIVTLIYMVLTYQKLLLNTLQRSVRT